MLKNGNYDESSELCPIAGDLSWSSQFYVRRHAGASHSPPWAQQRNGFPCFGSGCMNQPLVFHNWSKAPDKTGPEKSHVSLTGGFYGTYDVDQADRAVASNSSSFFSVAWHREEAGGSWQFDHLLRVSKKYPWLMLYLRADTNSGPSGGYPWDTRGMMHTVRKLGVSEQTGLPSRTGWKKPYPDCSLIRSQCTASFHMVTKVEEFKQIFVLTPKFAIIIRREEIEMAVILTQHPHEIALRSVLWTTASATECLIVPCAPVSAVLC